MFGLDAMVENFSNLFGTGDKVAERRRQDQIEDYKTMEGVGIQSKVAGAKAAGLHPLAVLGNVGSVAPSIPTGSAPVSGVGESVQRAFSKDPAADKGIVEAQRQQMEQQARLTKLQADGQEISNWENLQASQRRVAGQPGNPSANMPRERENAARTGLDIPGVKTVPNEIKSSTGGRTTGVHPSATTVRVPIGRDGRTLKMDVPSGPLRDSLEESELGMALATIMMNRDRMGTFFTDDIPWAVKGWSEDIGKGLRHWADRFNKGRKGTRGQY